MKLGLLATSAIAATLVALSPACAVEGGVSPYLKGITGFMSGVLPPEQGFYLSNIYYYLHGSVGAEVRGGVIELGVDTTLNADLLQGVYVTDFHILGGQYAFGATLGWAWLNLDATIDTPLGQRNISLDQNGFADSIFTPVLLGWHAGDLHWNIGFSVYAPTGSYNVDELSISKNVWGFFPQFAITYFDPRSGWDISSNFVYVTMTKNDATDYQSGDILHIDWAVGKHFGAMRQWEIGVVGNVVQQVGADRGTGAKLGPLKAESLGIGPSISYSTKFGNTPMSFSAKWEHDINSHNTFGGDIASVSATVVF